MCPIRGSNYDLWRINGEYGIKKIESDRTDGQRGTEEIDSDRIWFATRTPSDLLGYAISTGPRISMITHPWRGGRDGFDESVHIARQRQSDAPEKIESDGTGFATRTLSDLLGYSISTRGGRDGFDESMHIARQRQSDAPEKIESDGIGFATWTPSDLLGYAISTYPKRKQPAASIN
jgi:hypothetical protein